MSAPVIMVHGAFCGGWAFDAFKAPFEAAGHRCMAPDLPGHGLGDDVTGKTLNDYAQAVTNLIAGCETPPVVIGHSLGGLVAQIAAARTKVQSLVLLAPSSPWGVSTGSMEEAATAIGLMGLGAYWTQAVAPDSGLAATYSLDKMAKADRDAVLARMVPESGRALWETFNWWLDPFMGASVPFGAIKVPVLAAAGGKDRIHPPSTVRQIAERLGADFRTYPDMSHWMIGEPGFEDVAQDCVDWIDASLKAAA